MAAPGELGLTFAPGERVAERYLIVRFRLRALASVARGRGFGGIVRQAEAAAQP